MVPGKELVHWRLTGRILDAALEVHRTLGPGLLETAYETCLSCELQRRGLRHRRQVVVPLRYKGLPLEKTFRVDFIVEGAVILEIKAADEILALHEAQLLTYMRLTGLRVGLILNFNTTLLRDGIVRKVL